MMYTTGFEIIIQSTPVVLEWIGAVNYNRPLDYESTCLPTGRHVEKLALLAAIVQNWKMDISTVY